MRFMDQVARRLKEVGFERELDEQVCSASRTAMPLAAGRGSASGAPSPNARLAVLIATAPERLNSPLACRSGPASGSANANGVHTKWMYSPHYFIKRHLLGKRFRMMEMRFFKSLGWVPERVRQDLPKARSAERWNSVFCMCGRADSRRSGSGNRYPASSPSISDT